MADKQPSTNSWPVAKPFPKQDVWTKRNMNPNDQPYPAQQEAQSAEDLAKEHEERRKLEASVADNKAVLAYGYDGGEKRSVMEMGWNGHMLTNADEDEFKTPQHIRDEQAHEKWEEKDGSHRRWNEGMRMTRFEKWCAEDTLVDERAWSSMDEDEKLAVRQGEPMSNKEWIAIRKDIEKK